ncbi:MAG: flagellin lysine-N-methylase [Candidatus Merdivicinus sp.]|jgi:lysine-N-methylase
MQIYVPDYYHKFHCLASACQDNCCIGWEIDIDEAHASFYRELSGPFAKRMQHAVQWQDFPPHFQLVHGRCPFLNSENLCDLYLELGEKSLCEICTEHPRFHEWYGSRKESGLGLCCEAAAELILNPANSTKFVLTEDSRSTQSKEDSHDFLLSCFVQARDTAITIAQNRKFTLSERMAILLAYAAEQQECIDFESWESISDIIKDYTDFSFCKDLLPQLRAEIAASAPPSHIADATLQFFLKLENYSKEWPVSLHHLRNTLSLSNAQLQPTSFANSAENLFVYFLFRYLLPAVRDSQFLSRTKFCILLTLLIGWLETDLHLQNKRISFSDYRRIAQLCSKELEYSESNLHEILTACTDNSDFSYTSLLSLTFSEYHI